MDPCSLSQCARCTCAPPTTTLWLCIQAGEAGSAARRLGSGAWYEASVPVSDLPYAARQLQSEHNVYLTQNRFFSRRRLVAHLAELDALFADADPRHILDLAVETLAQARLPEPTFALATGRGLALIWLHSPVPRAALPRWPACQIAIHPTASVCYARSSPIEGSDRRRFYAVLGVPPINSAADAVRAAIVANEKKRRAAYK